MLHLLFSIFVIRLFVLLIRLLLVSAVCQPAAFPKNSAYDPIHNRRPRLCWRFLFEKLAPMNFLFFFFGSRNLDYACVLDCGIEVSRKRIRRLLYEKVVRWSVVNVCWLVLHCILFQEMWAWTCIEHWLQLALRDFWIPRRVSLIIWPFYSHVFFLSMLIYFYSCKSLALSLALPPLPLSLLSTFSIIIPLALLVFSVKIFSIFFF